eukprot:GHRR01019769.1.p1 GENE.GHRR01019769.1~~GHRR01019769.1.p1  ORF type:complete len:700 (+),score=221.54 GHRR01019769.1:222-2321(+)
MASRVARIAALCARVGEHTVYLQRLQCAPAAGEHKTACCHSWPPRLDHGFEHIAPRACAGTLAVNVLKGLHEALSQPALGPTAQHEVFAVQQYHRYSTAADVVRHYGGLAAPAVQNGDASESDSEGDQHQQVQQLLTPEEYRQKYQMWVDAKDAPPPCQTFEQATLPQAVLAGLLRHGFSAPTFIQAQAWPIARQGRDLVAIASTGSGKTAGFLVPAFLHIQEQMQLLQQHQHQHPQLQQPQQRSKGVRGGRVGWSKWNQPGAWSVGPAQPPIALVMAPTRELAQQTQQEADRLGTAVKIKNACLYGGAPKSQQGRALTRGPQLVIATPGRLLDFINSGEVNVSRVSMLILDEADRMLDMGFEPQIREVLDHMQGGRLAAAPKDTDLPTPPRQTLFFSATWPKEVQAIARQLCKNDPVRVFVGNVQDKLVANRDVTQLVAMLGSDEDRLPALMDYLHEHLHGAEMASSSSSNVADQVQPRVVVFAQTKRDCDQLTQELMHNGIRTVAVHGDKTQMHRDRALQAFRDGKARVLIATDVAARGLDIAGVTAVVNYQFPVEHEMYVHRIGRTGRAGRKGEALTLLTPQDASITPVLVQIMKEAGQEVPAELEAVAYRVRKPAQSKQRYGGGGGRGGSSRGGRGRWGGNSSRGGRDLGQRSSSDHDTDHWNPRFARARDDSWSAGRGDSSRQQRQRRQEGQRW